MTSSSWKRDFASGLIVLLPILVTLYVLIFLYGKLATPLNGIITSDTLSNLGIVGLSSGEEVLVLNFLRAATTLAVFVVLVFSAGYLMRTTIGDYVERALDDLMNQVPGLRVVYNASKMAVETAVSGTEDLQTPVRVEPWQGMRMTAFKTGKSTEDGRDLLFLPTAPNITSGYVIEVKPENYEVLDERVEDALTRILSAGFGDTDDEQPQMQIGVSESVDDD